MEENLICEGRGGSEIPNDDTLAVTVENNKINDLEKSNDDKSKSEVSSNGGNSKQPNQLNKKYNRRRRRRSFRSRKNSGGKFNFKKKKGVLLFDRDQARRHQLFFTDSQRLVPYNTNEFLMEDHYPKLSPNFNYQPCTHDSFSSSDCGMSGSLDEDEFLTKEFRIDYENLRSEQLHDMSKEQLIQEYLKLENQTELSMKAKENEIIALNNKVKELTRRLTQKNGDAKGESGGESDNQEDSSDSSCSSSTSCSSSDSEMEEKQNADEICSTVITEPLVSC